MYFKRAFYTLLILLSSGIQLKLYAQNRSYFKSIKLKIQKVEPPFFNFYAKVLYSDSIAVRSSEKVDNDALVLAGMKIQVMLKYMPAVKHNLIQRGAEMHIIASNQETSDLPEYRELKGKPYKDNRGLMYKSIDERGRGFGNIYACCPEENLLGFMTDRGYENYDVCAHEFAHVVMDFGLDQSIRDKIRIQYHKSISRGLWKGQYTATNPQEYWAEMSAYYFGANGGELNNTKNSENASAPEALRGYDEEGYSLVDSVYTGLLQPAMINMQQAIKVPEDSNPYAYNNTQKCELTVVNNTGKKLLVYLNNIPAAGNTVSPYLHKILAVWASQIVIIKDGSGKVFGYYKAVAPNSQITISD